MFYFSSFLSFSKISLFFLLLGVNVGSGVSAAYLSRTLDDLKWFFLVSLCQDQRLFLVSHKRHGLTWNSQHKLLPLYPPSNGENTRKASLAWLHSIVCLLECVNSQCLGVSPSTWQDTGPLESQTKVLLILPRNR